METSPSIALKFMMPSEPKGKMFTMKKDRNNSCLKEANDI